MTDTQILNMKAQGRLKIDRQTGRVWVWHRRKRRWIEKKEDYHPKSGRARFRFDVPGIRRSTVYKNRLLYVYFNGETNGHYVDHKNGDKTDDSVSNLQLHTVGESGYQGYTKAVARNLQECLDYFDQFILDIPE